jgi:hypothetical protein
MRAAAGTAYAVHPALGIARLGNLTPDLSDPETFYLGAEAPYEVPNAGKPYKRGGRIKKQAQRFRIYEYQDGAAVREITLACADVAAIDWTVHVANRKAALDTAAAPGTLARPAAIPPAPWGLDAAPPDGADPSYWPATTRNAEVTERDRLCIDPGPRSVGAAVPAAALDGSIGFCGVRKGVVLGSLRVEPASGRLLVFAGDGTAEGLDQNGHFSPLPRLADWGNNNAWYDNTADGWVTARILFTNGTAVTLDQPAARAWVICAAPRYSPALDWITTLLDVAVDVVGAPLPPRPSFARDIYPVLRVASLLPWVSVRAAAGHGNGGPGDYLSAAELKLLMDTDPAPSSDAYKLRDNVFRRLRDPNRQPIDRASVQYFMPEVSGDITSDADGDYDIAVLTRRQYAMFKQWRDGDFCADGVPSHVPLEQLDIARQPAALDAAAVAGTAGTPFYPGIESWRILRAPALYAGAPLRFAACTQPGDLTIGNALPWQADFLDCNDAWWPVQRPNQVTRDNAPLTPWVPEAWRAGADDADYNAMVRHWWQLGFVVAVDNGARYVEVEGNLDTDGAA